MKAAMRSRGIVPMPLWAVRTAICPSLAMVTGVQVRAKHYISYRLEGEDDPYRHLRRRKSPAKKTRSSLHSGGEEASMMSETEEEASRSSSSLASFLFGHPDSGEPGPRPAEAAAAMEQRRTEVVTGMGMGMGGGVVHRSKAVMPSRRRFVEGTPFGGAGGLHNHQQHEQEQRLRQEQPHTPQDTQADERRQRGGPMADAPRVEGEHEHDHNHQPAVWVPQAVKDTSKKVLESVGGAAASVGHTAKQLWDGALMSMGAHRPDHQHEGLMEKAKDVGKGTAHVVDTGYERAIEKAADKMLEALDVSLRRAKARGFPPGLTVTTIASAMGAQLIMAYTTKEEDTVTPTGRKDENVAHSKRPASRTTAQRGQAKKSSSGATDEAAAGASAARGHRKRNGAAPKQDSSS